MGSEKPASHCVGLDRRCRDTGDKTTGNDIATEEKKMESKRFGKISRRNALKGAGAIVAATALPALAQEATPQRGGTLRIGLDNASRASDSLDPRRLVGALSMNTSRQIYNPLVTVGTQGELVPEVAVGWRGEDRNTRWVFDIRDGVEFHNGKTVTADDVIYSINIHRAENSGSAAAGLIRPITNIEKIDDRSIAVTLEGANGDFPYIMTDPRLVIIPDGHEDFENPVGTGGYRFESFEPGVAGRTTRLENYYAGDTRAFVDAVENIAINDVSARTAALRAGEIDIMINVSFTTAALLDRSPDIQLMETRGKTHGTFPMDANASPFSNRDFQLALKHAVDRNAIIQQAYGGYGSLGNDHPVAPLDPFYNADLPQREADPDRAAFHYRESGMTGIPIELSISPAKVDVASVLIEGLRQAGIEVTLRREPADGYWNNVWLKAPWCASEWGARPTVDIIMTQAYASSSNWNETRWQNDRFEELLLAAREETDHETRKAMYWEIQELIYTNCPTIIPVFNSYLDAARSNVNGFVPNPGFGLSDYRAAERVWFS